uniref:Uncharacterized protein n=1 Tax=Setaria italica TaxID=4555 RepID=K4A4F6_SETIT
MNYRVDVYRLGRSLSRICSPLEVGSGARVRWRNDVIDFVRLHADGRGDVRSFAAYVPPDDRR